MEIAQVKHWNVINNSAQEFDVLLQFKMTQQGVPLIVERQDSKILLISIVA